MFEGCTGLSKVLIGGCYSFKGNSDNIQCTLPSGEWISMLTGNLYSEHEIATGRDKVLDIYILATKNKNTISLPAETNSIGSEAFKGISDLLVYVPTGVISIADDAFDKGTIFVFVNDVLTDWAHSHGFDYIITPE